MPTIRKSYMIFTSSQDRDGELQPSALFKWADTEEEAIKIAKENVEHTGVLLIARVTKLVRLNDIPVLVEDVP